jgi:hypothetical protein
MLIPDPTEFQAASGASARMTAQFIALVKNYVKEYTDLLDSMQNVQFTSDARKRTQLEKAGVIKEYLTKVSSNEFNLLIRSMPPHYNAILLITEIDSANPAEEKPYSGPKPNITKHDIKEYMVTQVGHGLFHLAFVPGMKPDADIQIPEYTIVGAFGFHVQLQSEEQRKQILEHLNAEIKKEDPEADPYVLEHIPDGKIVPFPTPTPPNPFKWPEKALVMHILVQKEAGITSTPEGDKLADEIASLAKAANEAGIEWKTPDKFEIKKITKQLREIADAAKELQAIVKKHMPPMGPDQKRKYEEEILALEQKLEPLLGKGGRIESYILHAERNPVEWGEVMTQLVLMLGMFEHILIDRFEYIRGPLLREAEMEGTPQQKLAKKDLEEIEALRKKYKEAYAEIAKAYPEIKQVLPQGLDEKPAEPESHNGGNHGDSGGAPEILPADAGRVEPEQRSPLAGAEELARRS